MRKNFSSTVMLERDDMWMEGLQVPIEQIRLIIGKRRPEESVFREKALQRREKEREKESDESFIDCLLTGWE